MSRLSTTDKDLIEQMKRLQKINQKLGDEEKLSPKEIGKIWEILRRNPLCGELIDIVNKQGEILGQLDAMWAHRLGLAHQTANAFIVTKTGRLILQRRVHNTRFPLYLSIPGGHLKASQSYEEGIRSEISEELNLLCPPRGQLTVLDRDFYSEVQVGDRNVEHRVLYLYQLTQDEYKWVKTFSRTLEMKKSELTREAYKAFLKREQKKPGHGEVWGIYEVDINNLEQAKTSEANIEELGITANLHYITLTDRFKDGEVTGKAYFTPDLLERIVNNADIMRKLKSKMGFINFA